jgi:hypothetical protein
MLKVDEEIALRHFNGSCQLAYDAWPADPVGDARHTFWPAGFGK